MGNLGEAPAYILSFKPTSPKMKSMMEMQEWYTVGNIAGMYFGLSILAGVFVLAHLIPAWRRLLRPADKDDVMAAASRGQGYCEAIFVSGVLLVLHAFFKCAFRVCFSLEIFVIAEFFEKGVFSAGSLQGLPSFEDLGKDTQFSAECAKYLAFGVATMMLLVLVGLKAFDSSFVAFTGSREGSKITSTFMRKIRARKLTILLFLVLGTVLLMLSLAHLIAVYVLGGNWRILLQVVSPVFLGGLLIASLLIIVHYITVRALHDMFNVVWWYLAPTIIEECLFLILSILYFLDRFPVNFGIWPISIRIMFAIWPLLSIVWMALGYIGYYSEHGPQSEKMCDASVTNDDYNSSNPVIASPKKQESGNLDTQTISKSNPYSGDVPLILGGSMPYPQKGAAMHHELSILSPYANQVVFSGLQPPGYDSLPPPYTA